MTIEITNSSKPKMMLQASKIKPEDYLFVSEQNFHITSQKGHNAFEPFDGAVCVIKNGFDKIIAFFGLIFLLPLFFIIAAIITIESRGGIFFKQTRTGLFGEPFRIYKFRTMYVCEDCMNVSQAKEQDERITPFGRFLRRTSLDELPQLLNVLRGEMSIIGPRPHALAHDVYYSQRIPEYSKRFRAKPGISGLAQVSGSRGPTPTICAMEKRVEFDCEYIENWNFWLDCKILIATFKTVAKSDAF